jgi:hypothetical protein
MEGPQVTIDRTGRNDILAAVAHRDMAGIQPRQASTRPQIPKPSWVDLTILITAFVALAIGITWGATHYMTPSEYDPTVEPSAGNQATSAHKGPMLSAPSTRVTLPDQARPRREQEKPTIGVQDSHSTAPLQPGK